MNSVARLRICPSSLRIVSCHDGTFIFSPFWLPSSKYQTDHKHRLLNYTPQGMALLLPKLGGLLNLTASIVRLLTINSVNAYITSWVLYLSGGSEDPRLLLPAWISIATVDTPSLFTPQN
jgi:hypothetical protein